MNKSELAMAMAAETGLTRVMARKVLDTLFATEGLIAKSLRRGEQVTISGFGTFTVAKRKARTARNPRTGEKIKVGASKSPRFRASTRLKKAIR